jgi:hypothetical protein
VPHMNRKTAAKVRALFWVLILGVVLPALGSICAEGSFHSISDWWSHGARLSFYCPGDGFWGDDLVSRLFSRYGHFWATFLVQGWNALTGQPEVRGILLFLLGGVVVNGLYDLVKTGIRFLARNDDEAPPPASGAKPSP